MKICTFYPAACAGEQACRRPAARRYLPWRAGALLALAGALAAPAQGADADLATLSLEDLLKVELTTVSRKSQRLADTAAAAFVISADDIARSGATSIPELLRMVPGVEVRRLSSSRWAVSARGFNGRFANKLLVLMDGRSVYSPFFSGVFWEYEDTMLEDVDRIEVIRGPGAAMWGSNAVNGVINIITKRAKDTQGGLAVVHAGDEERAGVALRYGAAGPEGGQFRVWGKGFRREPATVAGNPLPQDDWEAYRAGFRWDQRLADSERFSLIGNVSDSHSGDQWFAPALQPPFFAPQDVDQRNRGANLLGRYERTLSNGSQVTVQAVLDQSQTKLGNVFKGDITTLDLDAQQQIPWGRHDLIWGVGYRTWHDRIQNSSRLALLPEERTQHIASAFVHGEIALVPERFKLLVGAKAEHNSNTGFEFQPNVRALWTPTFGQTLWASVSRAARTPSRGELDARMDIQTLQQEVAPGVRLPLLVRFDPNRQLDSEKLTAYELGYRGQWGTAWAFDAAAFFNRYSSLRSPAFVGVTNAFDPLAGPYLVSHLSTSNALAADTHGLELAADFTAAPWWRFQAAYTYLRVKGKRNGDPLFDANVDFVEGNDLRHTFSLRSAMTLGDKGQWDVWLRRVGKLVSTGVAAYTAVDMRYAFKLSKELEVSLVGQNLFDGGHVEGVMDFLPAQTMEIPRSVYLKAKWRF